MKRKPFTLTCTDCDAGAEIKNAQQAIDAGWWDIIPDDGPGWNYVGSCPDCGGDERKKYYAVVFAGLTKRIKRKKQIPEGKT